MKKTTIAVAAGLMAAVASASQAQVVSAELHAWLQLVHRLQRGTGDRHAAWRRRLLRPGHGAGHRRRQCRCVLVGPTNGRVRRCPNGLAGSRHTPTAAAAPSTYNDDDHPTRTTTRSCRRTSTWSTARMTSGDNNQGETTMGQPRGGGGPVVPPPSVARRRRPSRRVWFSLAQDSQDSPVSDGVVGIADRDDAPKRKRYGTKLGFIPIAPAANAH